MDLFHKIQSLVDKNCDKIPEGDYLEMCNTIKEFRDKVKPPRFLLDQNQPLTMSDYDPQSDGPPVYEPTIYVTDGQPQEWIDEEEYSGLNAFLEQLHADWAATDDGEEEEQRTNWENVLRDVQVFQFAQPMEVD